jgi:hypothetical protein
VDLERDPLVRLLSGPGEAFAGAQLPFFLLEDGSRMDGRAATFMTSLSRRADKPDRALASRTIRFGMTGDRPR